MIYGFVRQSGRQARIYLEIDKGTMVCLYLPPSCRRARKRRDPVTTTAPPRFGSGETVLIVDDEPTVGMLVAEVLEELGYVAIEAEDEKPQSP